MKMLLSFVFATLLLSACVSSVKKNAAVGEYHRTWFHSYTTLSLRARGDYTLTYFTLGETRVAEVGIWQRTNRGVTLHPTSNSYRLQFDGLRAFTLSSENEKKLLIPQSKDGDTGPQLPFEEGPNQLPEPTSGLAPGRGSS